jgi:hypothetical protein
MVDNGWAHTRGRFAEVETINPWSYPEDIEVIIRNAEWCPLDEISIIQT